MRNHIQILIMYDFFFKAWGAAIQQMKVSFEQLPTRSAALILCTE